MADFQKSQRYHSDSKDSSDCKNPPPTKRVCFRNEWTLSKSFPNLKLANDHVKSLQHFAVKTTRAGAKLHPVTMA